MSVPSLLGPLPTTVRDAQRTLAELWSQAKVESRAYTGNIIALTTPQHVQRVQEALRGLEGRYAGRQIIAIMEKTATGRMNLDASLLPQNGLYVERLTLSAQPQQLQGAILPLLRPATKNHVWWATQTPPPPQLLTELGDIADQVIADSLRYALPPSAHYALADLSWSRSAAWREAVAQLFDSPDAAQHLPEVTRLTVFTGPRSSHAALLFAGWVASILGWPNLDNVTFIDRQCERAASDLCGLELSGPGGLSFRLEAAEKNTARSEVQFDRVTRQGNVMLPYMSLAEGLARVMVRPERSPVFEAVWKLAHEALLGGHAVPEDA